MIELLLILAPCAPTPHVSAADLDPRAHVTGADEIPGVAWDARAVEHLWNRAGFGVPSSEVQRWVDAGPRALIDHLFAGQDSAAYEESERPDLPSLREYRELPDDEKQSYRQRLVRWHRQEAGRYRDHWFAGLVRGDDPLRDRMTLFWSGVFTTSARVVKNYDALSSQHQLLRGGALGSYGDLLRGIVREPAMLVFLNNDQNSRKKPNENLAREIMELFSLGEGNYTEQDIREAARALTGYTRTRLTQEFRFNRRDHDRDEKTILGETGRFDGDDLADILLRQDACATFVAESLLEYLEGVAPAEERVADYASYLRSTDYDVTLTLRRLFLDPAFYRDEVVGGRISSPVDYLVGVCRRLEIEAPASFLSNGAGTLGQVVFDPPNVKGWEEGAAWITTSSFMQRGNLAGALIGAIDARDLRMAAIDEIDEMMSGDMMMADDEGEPMTRREARRAVVKDLRGDEFARAVSRLGRDDWQPTLGLTKALRRTEARTDRELIDVLCDALLAVEAPVETRRMLVQHLRQRRDDLGIAESRLLDSRTLAEELLVELGHLILSLPEAQLH